MIVAKALLTLVSLVLMSCGVAPGRTTTNTAIVETSQRGLWVTRWDFRSEEDVVRAVRDARSIGITDIYWQVRGQADAYYASDLEPWGHELTKHTGPTPGFDPLGVAVREAKASGVRLHAWVNVMPLWRGGERPEDATHALNARPEWRLSDERGIAQALHSGYVVVNPVRDDVHDHIVRVIRDIVTRYDVDGIHLDYVRFLSDEIGDALMPGDVQSRVRFARETGGSSDADVIDRGAYRDWIRSKITLLVGRISRESLRGKSRVSLTAAVWRRSDLAQGRYLQDAQEWVEQGYMDAIMPMIYTQDTVRYRDDLSSWVGAVGSSKLVPGIGVYMHEETGLTIEQIAAAGRARSYALFAYASLFESPNPGQEDDAASVAQRTQRRDAIRSLNEKLSGP